jgi:predicted DNA-binding transcriptional regulator AlpA
MMDIQSTADGKQLPIDLKLLEGAPYIRTNDLLKIIPVSRSTLERWVKSSAFPAPIRVSHGVNMFICAQVREWLVARELAPGDQLGANRPR